MTAARAAEGTEARGSGRSCVVCRAARPTERMVRLGLAGDDQVVVLDHGLGRSAYVCIARKCLGAVTTAVLERGFKRPVVSTDAASLMAEAHRHSELRLLETMGLARRAGRLDVGLDVALEGATTEDVVLVADDLAERTARRVFEAGGRSFCGAETVGRALGLGRVGVVRIRSGRFAEQAAYWWAVWSETQVGGREREVA